MAGEINWKSKYMDIKAKYMESVDMAFRLGFEDGQKQATQDAAAQQQAQQQQQMKSMQGGANPNQNAPGASVEDPSQPPGEDGNGATQPAGPGQGIQQDSENPQGSELDQHIAKLESMIQKSEGGESAFLQESLKGLINLKKSMQHSVELKKSAQAIPAIAKALHKPAFKLSQQANHNLSSSAKAGVNMQQRIVTDIMAKWEQEEKNAGNDILKQLGIEGLSKKEK